MSKENKMSNEELAKAMKSMNPDANGGVEFVELDDEIDFHCTRCGACCMEREDIILNPYDIYNIAKAKNIPIKEVIDEYCTSFLGRNSCIPILVLKQDERNMCPFLKFNVLENLFDCSINDNKPGACMNHPIGVVRTANKNSIDIDEEVKFIKVEPCSYHKKGAPVKVEDFISDYLSDINNHNAGADLQFSFMKYVNVEKLVKVFIKPEENYINQLSKEEQDLISKAKASESKLIKIIPSVYVALYLNSTFMSDTNKPFHEQYEEMVEKTQRAAVTLLGTFIVLGIDITNPSIKEEPMSEAAKDEMEKFKNQILKIETEIKNERRKESEDAND